MNQIHDNNLILIHAALNGHVRIVGGAVRDLLSGIAPADIDLATPLSPDDIVARLSAAGIKTALTGFKHGTVTAIINHIPYEITTLRQDVQTDGRHALVAFTDSYAADARRRDFTMNALYMDLNGTIYDYVGGQADLKRRYVRFIGAADDRVQEDYLRILRYFRFWGKMGHGLTDDAALAACERYASKLTAISAQRKKDELFKILADNACNKTLDLMLKHNVLKYILPDTDIPALKSFLTVLPSADVLERLAILTNGVIPNLALSNAETALLKAFAARPVLPADLKAARLMLYRCGERVFRFYIRRAQSINQMPADQADRLCTLTVPVFPLKGQDLIDAGFEAGPTIKTLLDTAVELWADMDFCENKKLVLNQLLAYNKRIRS